LTSSEYQSEFDDLNLRGYQLTGITGLSSASGSTAATFAAVWNDRSWRGYHTHHQMTSSEYQSKVDEYKADGYQVIYVTGYASGANSRYAAIWSTHTERLQSARHNLPSSSYQATFDDLKSKGYQIVHVNAHEAGGKTHFAGIWVKEDGYEPTGRHSMSASTFGDLCVQLAGDDCRLTCMGGYREAGQDRYAAIWVPHSRTWLVHGRAQSSLAAFDSAVESYMKEPDRTIPGASLAVTRNGELVLARGYSWITEVETPVEPTSLFRLASISKTLTGAAIVLLTEEGTLSFSDKVVDLIDMPGTIRDNRVKDIKVEHLLHHVGGWDREVSGDPMSADLEIAGDLGMPLPITREAIIRWTNGKMLNCDPGIIDGWTYSNYGYMLLGQIIETVAGIPYEAFVQERLLEPLGIHRMRLGRTLLRNRLPGEVLYHSTVYGLYGNVVVEGAPQNVMYQYGGHRSIENIAAHGGWVGSAVDLVRFASSFDDPASCPMLSASSVSQLFATHAYGNLKPGSTSHYGCGWYIDRGGSTPGQSHGGTIEGTKTQLARWQDSKTGDAFSAALLFNKYDGTLDWDLLGLIRDTAAKITSWPARGFWEDYI
jgi:CubicO group peptidase (beta-lactamase class C family)